jgi:hypothetical protein
MASPPPHLPLCILIITIQLDLNMEGVLNVGDADGEGADREAMVSGVEPRNASGGGQGGGGGGGGDIVARVGRGEEEHVEKRPAPSSSSPVLREVAGALEPSLMEKRSTRPAEGEVTSTPSSKEKRPAPPSSSPVVRAPTSRAPANPSRAPAKNEFACSA